ncbi:hypothetical protein HPB49_005288 [Dermacentor silvarum]|uniref:Uncharacterized protein n=1 Tax=Dermacentor silvarum TaxID=543639 RepID=A0ACB8C2A8_DERSI|nr:hypothetical protein HPB49_005288 [Dermacentor silvarum]
MRRVARVRALHRHYDKLPGTLYVDAAEYPSNPHKFAITAVTPQGQLVAAASCSLNQPVTTLPSCRCESGRRHVVQVLRLKEAVNRAFQWPVVVQCASTLLLVCACMHKIVVLRGERAATGQLTVMALVYLPYVCVGVIDLAALSHTLARKFLAIRNVLRQAALGELPAPLASQVRFAHDTIDPSSFCLSGAGLFTVDLQMLVSVCCIEFGDASREVTPGLLDLDRRDLPIFLDALRPGPRKDRCLPSSPLTLSRITHDALPLHQHQTHLQ